jgi:hypothetical protein
MHITELLFSQPPVDNRRSGALGVTWRLQIDFPINVLTAAISGHGKVARADVTI